MYQFLEGATTDFPSVKIGKATDLKGIAFDI